MILDEKGALDLDASFTVNSTQDLSNRELEGFDAVASALRVLVPETGGEHSLEPRRIIFSPDGFVYRFACNESTAAEDLCSRMPLGSDIESYGANGFAFRLDKPLEVDGTLLATGTAGTICHSQPENSAIIRCGAKDRCEQAGGPSAAEQPQTKVRRHGLARELPGSATKGTYSAGFGCDSSIGAIRSLR